MITRRTFLAGSAMTMAIAGCHVLSDKKYRRLSLNPSTLRGYKLSFKEQVAAAVKAGYDGIEPWLKDVHAAKADGTLGDAVRIARDGGLKFVNGIAFGAWSNPDGKIRDAGIEETKRDMALLAEIGCPYVAASMCGVQKPGSPHLATGEIAERYGVVCELGDRMGVKPLLEYWGHSVNMCRLEDALDVLTRLGRKDAAVLPDVYHTYRGGGDFTTFARLRPEQMPVLHVNDYPATPERTKLVDADRVWPGAGIAPWKKIFAIIDGAGLDPWLSIELFNPSYWKTTPAETLAEGKRRVESVQRI